MSTFVIEGARAVLPGGLARVQLLVEDGRIAALDAAAGGAPAIDARGLIVAPAMVDIHGDAFERQVMPRPGVYFPVGAAILDTDRQLAVNGIATAYHALTLSWEPGLRSVARGAEFAAVLAEMAPRLTVENRLQLRWETFAFEALELLAQLFAAGPRPALAFNDHTSMALRAFGVAMQERAFEHAPDFAVAALDDPRLRQRCAGNARRAGLSENAYVARLAEVWERRDAVAPTIARVAGMAAVAGVPMLSHDDTRAETRAFYRGLGARIAEFPMTAAVAEAAKAAGDSVVFGAPNVVRGGSHVGSPSAGDMIEAGLCDILASDYFYPAMLAAVARLVAERGLALEAVWPLVAANPARACGLSDRGEIAPGQRADLLLLDWPEGKLPAVRATFSAGRLAYGTEGLAPR